MTSGPPVPPPRASRCLPVAVAWGVASLGFAALGLARFPSSLPYFWPSLAFAVVAVAYVRGDPSVFGKTRAGELRAAWRPWLWPYLGLMALVVRLIGLSGEPPFHRVARGLYLGRRPTAKGLPADVTLLVDVTAELSAPLRARVPTYLCEPTLDGAPLELSALDALARRIAAEEGSAYVHCAFGHGRSALVVAAALAVRGDVGTGEEGLALARRARPRVRPSSVQRRALRAWDAARLRGETPGAAPIV